MKSICLVAFMLLGVFDVSAQSSNQFKLDSLLGIQNTRQLSDSAKLVLWLQIHRQYGRVNNEQKSLEYLKNIIALANRLNKPVTIGQAYVRMGLFYHGVTDISNAEKYYFLGRDAFRNAGRADLMANVYLNLGALYALIPDYSKSLEVSQLAIEIFLERGDRGNLANCYFNIAGIYSDLNQESKAMEYLKKALSIFITQGENTRGVNVVYSAMGNAYLNASVDELRKMGTEPNDRLAKSLDFHSKAYNIAQVINLEDLKLSAALDLGKLYEAMGDRTRALKFYQEAYQLSKRNIDKKDQATSMLALGNFYLNEKNAELTLRYFEEARTIGEVNKISDVLRDAYSGLSESYEKLGDYDRALTNYRKYISVKDAIFNEEKEKEVTRKQLQIEFAIKEKDYQVRQLTTESDLQRQVLLAAHQQQQLAMREQKLLLINKEKDLQRLTFLKKEADLQAQKRNQKTAFETAKLQNELRASRMDQQLSKQSLQIQADKKVKKILLIAMLLAIVIVVVVVLNQRRMRKLNTIIVAQKSELEQLGKVKNRIFSIVSHDMRTPVNSVISVMQLLENENLPQEKIKVYAQSLKSSLHHTSVMMDNLLNWAASQMEGFNTPLVPVSVNEVIEKAVKEVAALADSKKIALIQEIPTQIHCLADNNMLLLVVRNLLNNAIKFTPHGKQVLISADNVGSEVVIKVQDSGIGMSEEQVQHFNKEGKFLGGGKSTRGTNNEKGTGLGLMLCRTFTDHMNGSAHVQSNSKEGTTFSLRFPDVPST